jgi:integrase
MSIHKYVGKRSNSWQVRVERIDPVTGKRKQIMRTCRTKREAEAFEAQWETEKAHGSLVDPAKTTVGELLREWLAERKHNLAAKTWEGYETTIRVHLLPAFDTVSVQRLTVRQLERFYTGKRATTGARSVELCYLRMSQVLDRAVRQHIIPRNPNVDVEKPMAPPAERRAWTIEQARQFLTLAQDSSYGCLWAIALHTGMRRGELLGLRWKDIDFEARSLRVLQTNAVIGGKPQLQPRTKSGSGRAIDLDPEAIALLQEHHERQQERRQAANQWHDYDLVFCGQQGKPIWPDDVRMAFKRLCKRAGVPYVSIHGQRQTMATLWLAAGVPVKVVQERLGHARPSIMMNIYAHAIPGMQRQAVEQMRSILHPTPQ